LPRIIRFGPFELDVQTAELRKHGIKIRLHEQPFRILVMLLNQPGEVVSREDLRKVLWPNDTVVEFEHSINAAIQRLRDALGDSADNPRYVETLPRRGYRFIGVVEPEPEPEPRPQPVAPPAVADVGAADLTGKILSHYRIVGKLGEGGMGVVYRAEDLKLGRQVALKFLPRADGELPESVLRRFEREARAASALNHPHICTIHGLEDLGGQPAIVMELVEGETLAARLAKGALPLAQSLALATQIAGALAEAHRRGIVHRDLKPANIMLTKSGVKVLDFGLAKMERAASASAEAETVTQKGAIVGTLQYMSPEQVQGKETDARSDIFSFGLVLYEMLTGRRAFEGESAASVMAGILEREPAPSESNIPSGLDWVLRRCLMKEREERWQSAADMKASLERIGQAAPPTQTHGRFVAAWVAAGLLAVALAVTLFIHLRQKPPEQPMVRLQILPPGNDPFTGWDTPVLSPDGTRVVFSNGGKLFVRSLDSLLVQELPGTGPNGHLPFWSPDGRSVAFFASQELKKISLLGGSPVVLGDVSDPPGGAWSRDGVIVFPLNRNSPLMRIGAGGGTPLPVTRLDAKKGEAGHAWPSFLPDGKHFLFTAYAKESANAGVFIGSLDSLQVTRLLPDETNAQYTEPGYVLFSRGGNLMAQPFDAGRLRFTGDPSLAAQEVSEAMTPDFPFAAFSACADELVYRTGRPERQFRWFDRKGTPVGDVGRAGDLGGWDLSPDGHALAVATRTASHWDIWVIDLVRGTNSRLTFGGGGEPSWSPDGRQIAFSPDNGPRCVVMAANGSGKEQLVAQLDRNVQVEQWTADGQYLILTAYVLGKPNEVWAVPLSGGRKPFPVVTSPFYNSAGNVSRDGKWIAYAGNETGRAEVYVQNFPPKAGKWQISTAGGYYPGWRADGRELFYKNGSKLMSVEVNTNAGKFEAGIPKLLFDMPKGAYFGGFSADGQKFLLLEQGLPQPFTVVLNWPAGIKR
jgi:serine/threonine protein kinase